MGSRSGSWPHSRERSANRFPSTQAWVELSQVSRLIKQVVEGEKIVIERANKPVVEVVIHAKTRLGMRRTGAKQPSGNSAPLPSRKASEAQSTSGR